MYCGLYDGNPELSGSEPTFFDKIREYAEDAHVPFEHACESAPPDEPEADGAEPTDDRAEGMRGRVRGGIPRDWLVITLFVLVIVNCAMLFMVRNEINNLRELVIMSKN